MMRFPSPPPMGLLAGDVGRILIFAAIACYAVSAVSWLFSRRRVGAIAFWCGLVCVIAAFGIHVGLLATQQYEFQYVFRNTQRDMPFLYRIAAAWASQEGSFLLWTLMSTSFAAIVARRTSPSPNVQSRTASEANGASVKAEGYRKWFTIICSCAIIGMLSILAYESPFRLLELTAQDKTFLAPGQTMVLPPDGMGLNPTLQNYWMVIHPWVIFIGFGSLLSLFAWAASAIIIRDWSSWVNRIRPFAIFSMTFLGIGLTMGGLWAYETLGWGGFWAWDPVENVSLVPFIATTVFVHGLYVQGSRGRFARGNLILGMFPFLWFIYGTYLTRSGALVAVSVHSFAKMNQGAHGWLLGMVVATALAVIGFSLAVFLRKSTAPLSEAAPKSPGDRQPLLALGMSLVYLIGIFAAIGMSIPFLGVLGLRITSFGDKSVVGPEVYNRIVGYPFVPALLGMAIVPFLGWTKTRAERWRLISNLFFVTVLLFGILSFFVIRSGLTLSDGQKMPTMKLAIFFSLIFVCLYSVVSNVSRLIERLRAKAGGVGAFVMHSGVSILLLGLIVSNVFEKTRETQVALSFPSRIGLLPNYNYIASLESLPAIESLTKSDNTLNFKMVNENTGKPISFTPNFYYNSRDGDLVSRPAIKRTPLYDLYFIAGSPDVQLVGELPVKLGETKSSGDFTIKYLAKTQSGQPGMSGTRFGAKLIIQHGGKKFPANPEIELGGAQGTINHDIRIGEVGVVRLEKLIAGDGTAVVSILPPEPIFPVKMFFKPLTILVWLGAGMMTLGGLLAVGKRRRANILSDAATQPSQIEDTSRAG